MLKIFNSLTGEKQEFKPLRGNEVRMYVCGMTNYDYIHVGHARMLVAFDLVQRYLRSLGYQVTYVRNVTDIDDKIIERAAADGENWADLARRFTTAMHEDCADAKIAKSGLGAQGDRIHRSDHRHDSDLDRQGLRLCGRERRCDVLGAQIRELWTALSRKKIDDLRAGFAGAGRHDCQTKIPWTSSCGSMPSRVSRRGTRPGAEAGRDGTSNARRCRPHCWEAISICTAAAKT